MKLAAQWIAIIALLAVYAAAAWAALHPHVSPEYRMYFIDRTTTDYYSEHYDSTPEEGMIFSRPGLPQWVRSTHGFSFREAQGRWTDEDLGSIAGLAFNRSFSGDLCVDAAMRAIPWAVGDTITLRMENQEKPIQIRSADLTEYPVQLSALNQATSLDFVLPPKLPPVMERVHGSNDPRRLGINIASLKLTPGECSPPGR